MYSDHHQNKRARLNFQMNINRFTKREGTGNGVVYSPESKPVPSDLAEFLADPYQFKITDEFLSQIVLDVCPSFLPSYFYFLCDNSNFMTL